MTRYQEYINKYRLISKQEVKNGDTIVLFDLGHEYVIWNYIPMTDGFYYGTYISKERPNALVKALFDYYGVVNEYGGEV